jgi:hypothetical protein
VTLGVSQGIRAVVKDCGGRTMADMLEDVGVRRYIRVSSRSHDMSNRGGEALGPCKMQ